MATLARKGRQYKPCVDCGRNVVHADGPALRCFACDYDQGFPRDTTKVATLNVPNYGPYYGQSLEGSREKWTLAYFWGEEAKGRAERWLAANGRGYVAETSVGTYRATVREGGVA